MKPTLPSTALCAGLFALGVAGCGSSDKKTTSSASNPPPASTKPAPSNTGGTKPSGGGASKLTIAADSSGQLKFDKTSLSAKAGTVTITMDNPSPVAHAISVEGNGVDKHGKTVNMGGQSIVTAKLKPGKYTFYCPVDGHKKAGMEGSLTVK
jgi:plastocyanin